MQNVLYMYATGYEDCQCTYDSQDLLFCQQYSTPKPAPVGVEFLELAAIIMDENEWYLPNSCEEALVLFMNITNEIDPEL